MSNRRSKVINNFESTLAAQLTSTGGSATLVSASGLVADCYLTLEPDDPAKREYIFVSAVVGNVITISERYLSRSAASSGLTHEIGAVVRMTSVQQMWEDLHDRLEAHNHTGGLAGVPVASDHGALADLSSDARHDVTARHTAGTVIPTAAAGASAPADTAAEGTAATAARSDHRHSREAHGTGQHGSAVVDHGSIGGLADNDHPQYLVEARRTLIAANGRLRIPPAGDWCAINGNIAGNLDVGSAPTGVVRLYGPFIPLIDLNIIGIGFQVGTSLGSCRVALYDTDSAGLPDVLLIESGSVGLVNNNNKIAITSTPLTKGKTYWVGAQWDNSGATLVRVEDPPDVDTQLYVQDAGGFFSASGVTGYTQSQAYGAFPANLTPAAFAATNPALLVRVA
jgi:hypothetical protein